MPPPPRRSYATPQETFGITQKPLNEWFDFAASGLPRQGPAFSSELDAADTRNTQRELDSIRLQRELDSEQAAEQFLSQAAGQNPQGLMRMLAENPSIMASKDAPMIRDYVAQRQAVTPEPYSNKTLGPVLAKSVPPEFLGEFTRRSAAGEEVTEIYEDILRNKRMSEQQTAQQKAVYDALAEGAIDDTDVDVIMSARDKDRAIAAAMGKAKRSGRGSGDLSMKDYLSIRKDNRDDLGEVIDPEVEAWVGEGMKRIMAPKAANPSTGAVVPQGAFDAAAAESANKTAVDPVATALPPALPATPEEERQLAEQQRRGASELQKQQLADAAWTGVKGTAAARNAPTGDALDIVSEARKAIVGGQTTSKRAQRIAALARASIDGRDVNMGPRKITRIDPGSGVPFDDTESEMVPPAEALVRELGFEPDAIVGQAPSRAGGIMRNITALEAAQAILADAADPFIKLKEKQGVVELDASEDALIEAELEKGRKGTPKTN